MEPISSAAPQGGAPSCRQPPGAFIPVIDRNRCEGKGPCVTACPYGVLGIRKFGRGELGGLSLLGPVKAWAHNGMQAELLQPDLCRACGLCVSACPERAITLARAPASPA
jgi:NAD-dependent dihydropyrimidine dehydrogenase PreA subunit